jgi:hypothetical protein
MKGRTNNLNQPWLAVATVWSRVAVFVGFAMVFTMAATTANGQSCSTTPGQSTPTWTACDLEFELTEATPNVDLRAEFRSPRHRTYLMPAFREGDRRLVIRFSPTEPGTWDFRLTSNMARLDGQEGQFTASDSETPGFVRVANVHHFQTEDLKPHLWMSTALDRFTTMPRAEFDAQVNQRSQEKFTHLRVVIEANANLVEAAARIRAINAKGMVADVVLASLPSDSKDRTRYVTDIVARFAAFNITWAGVPAFEDVAHGRMVMKETGELIKRLDPFNHPRTSLAKVTSGALLGDAWMSMASYGTVDSNVGAVEHQLFQAPALNTAIKTRQDLWNAFMDGQYPSASPAAGAAAKVWFDFVSQSRYWELEPYFDVDGGRAMALDGTEYLVYVEKPSLVELTVENHGYDVVWMNPANGEVVKAKDYKGEHFTGEPPDKTHDWVLRLSREGRKEGMLKSYKFESRRVPVQEVEMNALKIPYDVETPAGDSVSLGNPGAFALKIKRQTRATRDLLVQWTAEVVVDGEGYRVAGTGMKGMLEIPKTLAAKMPGVLSLRVNILNANGKAYVLDKVYRLLP